MTINQSIDLPNGALAEKHKDEESADIRKAFTAFYAQVKSFMDRRKPKNVTNDRAVGVSLLATLFSLVVDEHLDREGELDPQDVMYAFNTMMEAQMAKQETHICGPECGAKPH